MSRSTRAVIVSLFAAVLIPTFASAQPAPQNQSAFQKEWAEVVKKYPHVAHSYLMALQALNEGSKYALLADAKLYQVSRFRTLVAEICLQRQEDGVPCLVIADPPEFVKKCPNCRGACALPQTAQECSDCLQRKGDANCL